MALLKAYIEREGGSKIECMFNPDELSLNQSNSWSADAAPGRNAPSMTFDGGSGGSLSLSLTLDTTDTGKAVTAHTAKLMELMAVDEKLPGYDKTTKMGRPPWVKFHWGDFHSFKAVVESLDLTYTYFADDGTPLRARANLSLKQYEPDDKWAKQNPTSGTPDPHRIHRVRPGDTLDRIAAEHYGTSAGWRDIAHANGIRDPLAITPGTVLSIPRRRA